MLSESEKEIALLGRNYLRTGKFVAPMIGGILSLCSNPFVAEAGYVNGMFAHALVAAGSGIGFSVCAGAAAYSAIIPSAVAATAIHAVKKSYDTANTVMVLTLSAAVVAGTIGGGVEGYRASSQMLRHGTKSYKSVANETGSRVSSPVRVARDGNKVTASMSPRAVLGG